MKTFKVLANQAVNAFDEADMNLKRFIVLPFLVLVIVTVSKVCEIIGS